MRIALRALAIATTALSVATLAIATLAMANLRHSMPVDQNHVAVLQEALGALRSLQWTKWLAAVDGPAGLFQVPLLATWCLVVARIASTVGAKSWGWLAILAGAGIAYPAAFGFVELLAILLGNGLTLTWEDATEGAVHMVAFSFGLVALVCAALSGQRLRAANGRIASRPAN